MIIDTRTEFPYMFVFRFFLIHKQPFSISVYVVLCSVMTAIRILRSHFYIAKLSYTLCKIDLS